MRQDSDGLRNKLMLPRRKAFSRRSVLVSDTVAGLSGAIGCSALVRPGQASRSDQASDAAILNVEAIR